MTEDAPVSVGAVTLDLRTRKLIGPGGRVDLGADACRVAERLMRDAGKAVATTELVEVMATSGEGGPEARLRACISRIGLALVMLTGGRPRIRSDADGYLLDATR